MRALFTLLITAFLCAIVAWGGSCAGPILSVDGTQPSWAASRVQVMPDDWTHRGGWLGSDACKECHEEDVLDFVDSAHASLLLDEAGWGCESCHGPGEAHLAANDGSRIDDFELMDAVQASARCARCHFEDLRALDAANLHAGADTHNCSSCHAIHPWTIEAYPASEPPYTAQDCAACHQDALTVHLRSQHASLVDGPQARGCESCHGNGKNHILSGGRDPMEVAQGAGLKEQCLDCHADSTGLHQWDRGAHHNAGLDCLTCHDLLQERGTTIRFPEQQLCASCHGAQVAEFHANSSHPLGEGGLQCSDCHDVHGQSGTLLDQRQLRERCEECHRSQSGPFAHGHEADRFDGCLACHEAHGSPNRKLLTAEPVRLLCLQCHADTPLNHNQQPLSVFQNCLSCHTEIHGSNLDRRLFR